MRLSIVALTLGVIALAAMAPASQAETNDTQTKTENQTLFELSNSDSPALSLDTLQQEDALATLQQTSTKEEEANYDAKLSNWKKKQASLWENLPKGKFTINASAYTASADECGKNDGITASGLKVKENRTLACPANMPFGTKIRIDGMGTYVCEDRGGAIVDNHIDIYVQTKAEAFAFGRRTLGAEIIQ